MLQFLKRGQIDLMAARLTWQLRRKPKLIEKSRESSFDKPPYKIHFGPGAGWTKPDDKWLSVDVDPDRGDIIVDFHEYSALPLGEATVEAIYASHTFEHISIYRIMEVMRDCYRLLRPGGILRIVVPDPVASIEQYVRGNAEFPLFQRRREKAKKLYGEDWTLFECLKGDFISMNSQPDLLGEKLAHQNAWDFEAMRASLVRAGFDKNQVVRMDFKKIGSPDFAFEGTYPSEANEADRSLYVEAKK